MAVKQTVHVLSVVRMKVEGGVHALSTNKEDEETYLPSSFFLPIPKNRCITTTTKTLAATPLSRASFIIRA